jgi:hypothetical protein
MAVQARFWVQSIKKTKVSGQDLAREVILAPVIRATDDNIQWSKYTPSGEIRLVVTADAAGSWFEERIGQDIAITFSDPVDAE